MLNASTAGGNLFLESAPFESSFCVDKGNHVRVEIRFFCKLVAFVTSKVRQIQDISPRIMHFNIQSSTYRSQSQLPSTCFFIPQIKHHSMSSTPPPQATQTQLMGSQAPSKVAFQMGSRNWFTLSQWGGPWLHDEMVAPWN